MEEYSFTIRYVSMMEQHANLIHEGHTYALQAKNIQDLCVKIEEVVSNLHHLREIRTDIPLFVTPLENVGCSVDYGRGEEVNVVKWIEDEGNVPSGKNRSLDLRHGFRIFHRSDGCFLFQKSNVCIIPVHFRRVSDGYDVIENTQNPASHGISVYHIGYKATGIIG